MILGQELHREPDNLRIGLSYYPEFEFVFTLGAVTEIELRPPAYQDKKRKDGTIEKVFDVVRWACVEVKQPRYVNDDFIRLKTLITKETYDKILEFNPNIKITNNAKK